MKYIDAFVIPIPRKNLEAYQKMAKQAAKIWREYGALEFRECYGNDFKIKDGIPFPKLAKLKPSETVIFSWIVYKSAAHRKQVNAKVMKDPRILKMCPPGQKMSFDVKRMTYGGFKMIVDLTE